MAEKLTPQQQRAVNDRGGKLLVSAAAGSGKTKVLVDRLLGYLTDPAAPANVDDFLIITYTKAAAAELRGKIAQKLTERIAADPSNKHLQQQMQRIYLAKISTVHAFCTDLLRENAYRLDIAPDFRVADENECLQLQMTVLEQLLEDAYTSIHENDDFREFVSSQGLGRDDRQIPQILLKVYRSAHCHLNPELWLDRCLQQMELDDVQDAAQTIWGKYLTDDLRVCIALNIQALRSCADAAALNDTMTKPAALLQSTISQLEALKSCTTWDDILAHKEIDYGRLSFPKNCSDALLAEQIKAVRETCKATLNKKLRSFSDPSKQILGDLQSSAAATRGLVELTRQFSDRYASIKRKRRILDFADLEHKTLDLLLGRSRSGMTAAAAEIAERFREIMVDEYQDSNQVQDAIFSALTQKKNNCFMVGDVKQSIYQFRLADPTIFLDKYNSYIPAENAQAGQGRKVLLSSNFRSGNGVISAVNDVFSQCMSPEVGGLHYTEDEMLYEGIPHVSLQEPEVELYGIQTGEDRYEDEANVAADRIQQLLDGSHMVRTGDTLRPIRPEDIVILLRSPGSVGGEFRHALLSRGIPCTTGDSADLLQTEEVAVLISILQVISNPLQDIPLIAALSSRVFGFTADELAGIRAKNRYCSIYEALQTDTSSKSAAFIAMLSALRQAARMCRLPELLEQVLLNTGICSAYLSLADGKARCANLETFVQAAADFSSGGQRDLGQFLEHLQAMDEQGMQIPSDTSGINGVTIMSIHKSKGLEFPVVFLCGLSRSFNQENARAQVLCDQDLGLGLSYVNTKQRVRYPTVAKRAIATKIVAESISEEMRVLYVAMTRARDRLIMTYAAKNLESQLTDIALRLSRTARDLMTRDVDCPGAWVLQTAMGRTEAGEFYAISANPGCGETREPRWKISVVQAEPALIADLSQKVESEKIPVEAVTRLKQTLAFQYAHLSATQTPSKQTATQLKGRLKDQEASENTGAVTVLEKFRQPSFIEQRSRSTEYGNAVHAFMQYAQFDKCLDTASVAIEVKRLVSARLLTEQQADMLDLQKIAAFFESPIWQTVCSSKNILREFKFSLLVDAQTYYDKIADERILLQGVVDCAIIEPDGIVIIDFKTDRVTEQTLPQKSDAYRSQVAAYAKALERIFKLPVKSSYLYFFQINRFVKM